MTTEEKLNIVVNALEDIRYFDNDDAYFAMEEVKRIAAKALDKIWSK